MIILVCSILVTVDAGGFAVMDKIDVEGKQISSSEKKYLVDFSEGVKKYNLVGDPSDYSEVLVDKSDCVKK